jgi:tRNA(fMet)-specific endonuclease VapC
MEVSSVMLDTSAYAAFMRGHPDIKFTLQEAERVSMSPVVLGELHAGFSLGNRRAQNERELARFLRSPRVSVLPVSDDTAIRYAEILLFLRHAGTPIPTNDVWIAAGAMEHGLRIVTTDAHYTRVPQVLVDFWPV